SQVRRHVKAALSLLGGAGHGELGLFVVLVPVTFEYEGAETLEMLPEDTVSTCRVRTKIIRIERGAAEADSPCKVANLVSEIRGGSQPRASDQIAPRCKQTASGHLISGTSPS
ncbi:MAG: hypothetical protein ABJ059_16520, partial [Hyphomicrobiales bacterium]